MTDNRMKPYTVSQCCTAEWCKGYNEAVKKANEIIELLDIKIEHLVTFLAEAEKANDNLKIELQAMRGAANSYKTHYEHAKSEAEALNRLLDCLQKGN